MQHRAPAADDQRMAGVVSALEPHHDRGALGEQVHDLALPLVSPLRADDDYRTGHPCLPFTPAADRIRSPPRHQRLPRSRRAGPGSGSPSSSPPAGAGPHTSRAASSHGPRHGGVRGRLPHRPSLPPPHPGGRSHSRPAPSTVTAHCPRRSSRRRALSVASPGRRWITRSPRDLKSRTAASSAGSSDQGASMAPSSGRSPPEACKAMRVFRSALNPVAARARPKTLPISS